MQSKIFPRSVCSHAYGGFSVCVADGSRAGWAGCHHRPWPQLRCPRLWCMSSAASVLLFSRPIGFTSAVSNTLSTTSLEYTALATAMIPTPKSTFLRPLTLSFCAATKKIKKRAMLTHALLLTSFAPSQVLWHSTPHLPPCHTMPARLRLSRCGNHRLRPVGQESRSDPSFALCPLRSCKLAAHVPFQPSRPKSDSLAPRYVSFAFLKKKRYVSFSLFVLFFLFLFLSFLIFIYFSLFCCVLLFFSSFILFIFPFFSPFILFHFCFLFFYFFFLFPFVFTFSFWWYFIKFLFHFSVFHFSCMFSFLFFLSFIYF